MGALEIVSTLWTWTPFLAQGFVWNLTITAVCMTVGSLIGAALAFARAGSGMVPQRMSNATTEIARNLPTFVLLYYLAFMLPVEVVVGGTVYPIPPWVKACIALSIPVAAFMSDNLSTAIRDWRAGNHSAALVLVPNWFTYLFITLMTTSTTSVIGVPEIVNKCNTIIAAQGHSDLILWMYLYAMLWFFAVSFPLSLSMNALKRAIMRRVEKDKAAGTAPAAPSPVAPPAPPMPVPPVAEPAVTRQA